MHIKNVKCHDIGSKLRITFDWPVGVQQVYIFTSPLAEFDIMQNNSKSVSSVAKNRHNAGDFCSAERPFLIDFANQVVNLSDGKLFTLQEYKKLGGFVTEKIQGETNYYIYPFMREDGEDTLIEQPDGNSVKFIEKTIIRCQMLEKNGWGRFKNYEITVSSNYPVQEKILCYVKKKNAPPRDISDGTLYYWSDTINPGQTVQRVIRTLKDEHIRMFVRDEEKYGVV